MILLIDNYDSFTYNLAHLFGELGAEVVVRRNDAITPDEAEELAPSHLVVSPGPGVPADAGVSIELIKRLGPRVPTLGVCLGHQAIVDGLGIFSGLPQDFEAGRYHSLAAHEVPGCFCVSASGDHEVMAVRHLQLPIDGVQFHPESVLTPAGSELAKNFLEGRR